MCYYEISINFAIDDWVSSGFAASVVMYYIGHSFLRDIHTYAHIHTVIRYRYVQPEYSFNETDTSTEICVTIENGTFTFVQGGYLTLSFSTSPLSANG